MKLWNYLQEKMMPHSEKIAFAHSGITYGELIRLGEKSEEGKLRLCMGSTREEQYISKN